MVNRTRRNAEWRAAGLVARVLCIGTLGAGVLAGCDGSSQTQSATLKLNATVIGHVGDKVTGAPLVRADGQIGVRFVMPTTIGQAAGYTGTLVSMPSAAVKASYNGTPALSDTPLDESGHAVHTYLMFSPGTPFHVVAAAAKSFPNYPNVYLKVSSPTPERVSVVYRTACGRHAPVSEDSVNYEGNSAAVNGPTPLTQKVTWPLISVTNPTCWVAVAVAASEQAPVKLTINEGRP